MNRVRAFLASIRIANAPSVVSNVTLGFFLGAYYWGLVTEQMIPKLTLLAIIALLLLFTGNLANDWFDREWDARNRPERALPSGLFRPGFYLGLAMCFAAGALCLAFMIGQLPALTVGGILVCIAIYTRVHKRHRWAVIPMGLCRALLYLLGFLTAFHTQWQDAPEYRLQPFFDWIHFAKIAVFIFAPAAGLFVYVMGLSLAARFESLENPPPGPLFVARAMLFLPLAAMSACWVPYQPVLGVCGMIPFGIWLALSLTVFRKPIPRFVSALLAGIPLIDLIAAIPLGATFSFPGEGLSTASLVAFTTPTAAFLLGRLLQRLAPAT